MPTSDASQRHLYWFSQTEFQSASVRLKADGYKLSPTGSTPCQTLKSRGKSILYAEPRIWSGMCSRQGSWYRESHRDGDYMMMSDHRLPKEFDRFRDAEMSITDFAPEQLPGEADLQAIVDAEEYQRRKPRDWEKKGLKDAVMFKAFFTLTGFWGWGDNLRKYWLHQRANHANFLSRKVTTEFGGEEVPYSVTENAGVCSSCAEFFNVVEPGARKLVRSCPGAVAYGKVQRDVYYDIRPLQK